MRRLGLIVLALALLCANVAVAQPYGPSSSGNIPCGNDGDLQYNSSGVCGGYGIGTGLAVAAGKLTATGTAALTSAHIFVGNASNVAADVAPSGAGDCTLSLANTGVFTLTCTKTGGTSFSALATLVPGTGVATALGINVGTAGAPVINGGDLGTPSAGVATNLSGTAANLTAGHVTTNANLTGPVTSSGNATSVAAGVITAWVGTTGGTANAQTIASPTPSAPAFTLIDQYKVRFKAGASNTAAATLNINSTGATAVETNTSSGLAALKGGEIVSGLEYEAVYNSTCTCFVLTNLPGGTVIAGTSQTVTAVQWMAGSWFVTTTASQTITLPAVSTLSANGGIYLSAIGNAVTLQANAADAINGGSAGGTCVVQSGDTAFITSASATNVQAAPCGVASVGKIGASPASHAVPVDVAGTSTYKVIPDCTDTTGNHINYTQSTDAFSCGTSIPAATATTLATGTSVSLTAPREYYVCTGTCTVTPPVPAAGYEFCVMNDDNVATVITLAALGSSARYEATARTSYGTAGTGTLVSGGAAGDKVCLVGRDSTHYLTVSFNGTWTAN